jgi:hypothetical protein
LGEEWRDHSLPQYIVSSTPWLCVYYICNYYPPTACINFSSLLYMLHGPPITFSLI